ncbi:sorting nexin-8 isoform X1 [Spodoptera frugiperda]|uniref:Sorting nexin-8 isoform X1 n=1 Tax=Spodoptera frugiperda TaxID=7108 RepID=A0A9R0E8U9_SPOFR|nr:sorting nexin-8 isoform X1 [Spodoptera frugiperda]XP_050560849.1 sorting nexin-8 isoform X1 [Spodoptera frugiperda]
MSVVMEEVTFAELEATDVISVELVPERKGLILKHCEYYVSSRRHGTTVSRRYNDFVQLYDILYAKYPYRAICRLPPKRVVVGGGSSNFLLRRRAALQRWLTLVARHPVLAHDADLRVFLCESTLRLEKPKHDEFVLAGTQEDNLTEVTTQELQAAFESEQEPLQLAQLALARLTQIFEKVQDRCEAERSDMRELGAALSGLGAAAGVGADPQLAAAAQYVPRSSAAHRALGAERARTECCVQGGGRRGPRARAGVGRRRRGRAAAGRRRVRRLHGAVRAPVARPARGARRRRRRARRAARAAPATPLRLARCAAGGARGARVRVRGAGLAGRAGGAPRRRARRAGRALDRPRARARALAAFYC